MRALLCPASLKGVLSARAAAAALGRGVRAAGGVAVELPIADGGEGTLDALRGVLRRRMARGRRLGSARTAASCALARAPGRAGRRRGCRCDRVAAPRAERARSAARFLERSGRAAASGARHVADRDPRRARWKRHRGRRRRASRDVARASRSDDRSLRRPYDARRCGTSLRSAEGGDGRDRAGARAAARGDGRARTVRRAPRRRRSRRARGGTRGTRRRARRGSAGGPRPRRLRRAALRVRPRRDGRGSGRPDDGGGKGAWCRRSALRRSGRALRRVRRPCPRSRSPVPRPSVCRATGAERRAISKSSEGSYKGCAE